MIPLFGAAAMRELDAATIAAGLPAFTLMETAGRGVADRLCASRPRLAAVAVVCGAGGNGGDGFVCARVLHGRGVAVTAYVAAEPPPGSPAAQHRALYARAGGAEILVRSADELAAHARAVRSAEVVVDALFGVGLTRPVTGHFAEVIEVMNAAALRWSIDVPSGLCADRGVPLGAAVRADTTVSLGAHKLGVVTAPGFAYAGALELVELGLLPQAEIGPAAHLLEEADAAALLPALDPLTHKGRRGHVLVVGGARGMRGAGELAATAALRAGAGLVTWAAWGPAAGEVRAGEPAVMVREVAEEREVLAAAAGKAALCVGPGLGRGPAASALLAALLREVSAGPRAPALVLDADALFALAEAPRALGDCRAITTPHPMEAARLLQITVEEVEGDRVAAARALAERTAAPCLLKGARPVLCDGERVWLFAAGSEALATAGSGDVLGGVIAGLCAQGLAPTHAAQLAVVAHGAAGRQLAARRGPRGVIASELPAAVAGELGRLRSLR